MIILGAHYKSTPPGPSWALGPLTQLFEDPVVFTTGDISSIFHTLQAHTLVSMSESMIYSLALRCEPLQFANLHCNMTFLQT